MFIIRKLLLGILLWQAAVASAEPVTFPAYGDVRFLSLFASEADYAAAVQDESFVMERMTYDSGGLAVHAYVYRPAKPAARLPVVIFNRGGWTHQSFHAEMVATANRLARQGYLVVAPMYRGSGGAGGRDEMGGADLADLFNLVPALGQLPDADSTRLYLYGESRGGMMVYQAIRDGFPARAAAVVGAFTDLDTMLADPQWSSFGSTIWPDLPAKRAEIVQRRSAQQWAARLDKPILILHGAADRQVPPTHALDMASKLAGSGKQYQLMVIAGEGHTLFGRAADRDSWVADWFRRH